MNVRQLVLGDIESAAFDPSNFKVFNRPIQG